MWAFQFQDKSCCFNSLHASKLAEQQQDDQHHQNDAAKAHSGVAHAVAIAAEPAAEAAKQEDDQDNDKYQTKRHGASPRKRPADINLSHRHPGTKHIAAFGSSEGTKDHYFGCNFSAAELMQ